MRQTVAKLCRRVDVLEARSPEGQWHRLIWNVGQSWSDVLLDYGEDRIKPEDNVILNLIVDAHEGRSVHDPIRERDKPVADEWFDARKRRAADSCGFVR